MKIKKLSLGIFAFLTFAFAILFLASSVSALSFGAPSNLLTIANNQATITLTNGNVTQNIALSINNILDGTNSVVFTLTPSSPITNLPAGQSVPINITTITTGNLKFGKHTTTLTATGSANASETATAQITFVKSFCARGPVGGNLVINSVDIENSGDEDDEWRPLDKVEIEVEVENTAEDDIDDIIVELGLFDSTGRNQANDLDFENTGEEEIDLGNLNDGDEETVTFTFQVPPDFEAGSYKLAVKAFSDDTGESRECTDTSEDLDESFFENIDVEREDDEGKFIAFDNIEITPDQVTCGDAVTVSADVFNVGDDEQDQVKVNLVNSELGVRLEKEIREDLDEGDKTEVSFSFVVPEKLKDKLYILELDANYDYRNGNYRESSDEPTRYGLNVVGCEGQMEEPTSGRIASISASLDSDAKAGEEMIVKSIITNLGEETSTFIISASGFESWAQISSISERILSLDAGETEEITLVFDVNEDASEEQSFVLEARAGENVETREIAVNIESGEEAPSTPQFNFGDNNLLWIIGIINVVLIVLIIVVAVRISRR